MTWTPASTPPPNGKTVACIEGEAVYFAMVVNVSRGEWIETDRTGGMMHARSGGPIYVQPHAWCELPGGG